MERSEFANVSDPNQERRNFEIAGDSPLIDLLDRPWYPPYVYDCSHYHNCMEIGMCVSGHGRVYVGKQEWLFSEGSIVVVAQGTRHSQQNEDYRMTHWLYLLVHEERLLRDTPPRNRPAVQRMLDRARRHGIYFDAGESNARMRAVLRAMAEVYRRDGGAIGMELEALLQLLVARIACMPDQFLSGVSADEQSRNAIEPALRYVSENYAQEIRTARMAASCAMSESYFRKVFAQIMGMSPLEYVNRYRINRSINLLRSTNETVLTIASRTGFPSIATYNRNFQRYVGTSPAEWRKNARE